MLFLFVSVENWKILVALPSYTITNSFFLYYFYNPFTPSFHTVNPQNIFLILLLLLDDKLLPCISETYIKTMEKKTAAKKCKNNKTISLKALSNNKHRKKTIFIIKEEIFRKNKTDVKTQIKFVTVVAKYIIYV